MGRTWFFAVKKSAKDVKELRRVDFKVEGSACASCLGRIRKRMEAEDGVVEAAVMIKNPMELLQFMTAPG